MKCWVLLGCVKSIVISFAGTLLEQVSLIGNLTEEKKVVDLFIDKIRTFVKFKPEVKISKEMIKNMALKLYVEVKPVFERVSEDFGLFMGRCLCFFYEEGKTQISQALIPATTNCRNVPRSNFTRIWHPFGHCKLRDRKYTSLQKVTSQEGKYHLTSANKDSFRRRIRK